MTPAERWHEWQREGRPTLGAHKPLPVYLHDNAQFAAGMAFVSEAKGLPVAPDDAEDLVGTVADLVALMRERGIGLCNIAERATRGFAGEQP